VPYQRPLNIVRRLTAVLQRIGTGKYSTPELGQELVVSIPTIFRCATAQCERGHFIRAEKLSPGWRYVLDYARAPRTALHLR
jgi:hypothetical protein